MELQHSLFRYQRFSGWLRSVLVTGELYLPLLHELNDPCEYCYRIDTRWDEEIARKQLRHLLGQTPSQAVRNANPSLDVDGQLAAMRAMPFEMLIERVKVGAMSQTEDERKSMIEGQMRIDAQTIGISCFTERGASSYMSHFYAGGHSGVCLEFNGIDAPFSRAFPVTYQDEPPRFHVLDDPQSRQEARMFVKSTDWMQEREWRLVNHREVDGPTVNFNPDALTSLTLCPEFQESNLDAIRAWLVERAKSGYRPLQCYRFVRRQESYELGRIPLSLPSAA
jgi:hypothetical protein